MRVRAGLQREVEQYCSQLGVPTRTEVDAAHRKIMQLERELRRVRDALQERAPAPAAAAKPKAKAAKKPAAQPTAKGSASAGKAASAKTKGARR
jgi:polyhydroxyalkanoate synthase subunit PhaE